MPSDRPVTRWRALTLAGLGAILLGLALALPAGAFAANTGRDSVLQKPLTQGDVPSPAAAAPSLTTSLQSSSDFFALLAVQQATLTASDAYSGQEFGYQVALSGDTALVGAGNEQGGGAYVFTRSGATWSQQAELSDPNPASGDDGFGNSVALDGDTALVGAPVTISATDEPAGAVYVFTRSGTTWSEQAELNDPDGAYLDDFGGSVALDGDMALVGAAPGAYVFTRSGTTWSQQAELSDPGEASQNGLGNALALSGDTALVSAPPDTYIFTCSGTGWSQQAQLSGFSGPVAIDGETALIGTYVFTRSGTTRSQQAELNDPSPAAGDSFGISVALSGDTALVGASNETVGRHSDVGAAYIFTRSGTSWSKQAELSASDGTASDFFGQCVALFGGTALVGACGQGSGAGAAYLDALTTMVTPKLTLELSGVTSGTLRLGKRVTATGKVTPTSLAGCRVTLTVQRKLDSKWRRVTSLARTVSARGTCSATYKPSKKGSYRLQATITKTAAHTAATTAWRSFRVD
jgi:hypothetical protein